MLKPQRPNSLLRNASFFIGNAKRIFNKNQIKCFSTSINALKEDEYKSAEAKEKVDEIKKEVMDFLNKSTNFDKKKEKEQNKVSIAYKLGNIVMVLGILVGIALYVGDKEKKQNPSSFLVDDNNTDTPFNNNVKQQSTITSEEFLSGISNKVKQIKENNAKGN
ncbi:hypothetical protein ABK040_010100 [Willaertia magna]